MDKDNIFMLSGLLACLTLSIVCIYMAVKLMYIKNKADLTVMAEVIDIRLTSESFVPVLSYEVGGKKYIEESYITSRYSKWYIGEKIELKCQSKDPSQFCLASTGYGTYIMLFFGFIMFGLIAALMCYSFLCKCGIIK